MEIVFKSITLEMLNNENFWGAFEKYRNENIENPIF